MSVRDDYAILSWDPAVARVIGFGTTGRRGTTTIKIEMQVTNPWELGDIIRRLAELRDAPIIKPAKEAPHA